MSIVARYEPFSTEVDPEDGLAFDDYVVEKVVASADGAGWSVTSTKSWGFFVPKLSPVQSPPFPGDPIRVYGGLGYEIQGIVVNGHVVFYRDARQRAEKRAADLRRMEREKLERFADERDRLDAQYEALPEPFKARLDRFRAADPRFRVDAEAYESFILQQAALLADYFKTVVRVRRWADMQDYDEQSRYAPPGWDRGHSGNTHACSIRMAIALLSREPV